MALNKKCMVCGREYKYCYSCPSSLNNPSWMMLFDKKECREIFNILSMESQKKITKEEAIEKLNQYDLSSKDSFNEKVKNHIDKVLKVEEVICENVENDVETVDFVEEKDGEFEKPLEQKVSNKMRYSSKRNTNNNK